MANSLNTQNNIQIADKDIVCYACFKVSDTKNNTYTYLSESWLNVPIQNKIWKPNEVNQVIHDPVVQYYKQDGIIKRFSGEWFYTYPKKNSAQSDLYWSNKSVFFSHDSYVVCKCIIPEGSKYVVGDHYNVNTYSHHDTFASEKLMIVKVLK